MRISKPTEIPAYSAIYERVLSTDYLPDGRAMMVFRGEDEVAPTSISLIQGFDQELRRLVPPK